MWPKNDFLKLIRNLVGAKVFYAVLSHEVVRKSISFAAKVPLSQRKSVRKCCFRGAKAFSQKKICGTPLGPKIVYNLILGCIILCHTVLDHNEAEKKIMRGAKVCTLSHNAFRSTPQFARLGG